jgi:hypothetical protein
VTSPYTSEDLRAEAARQHAKFTAEPDLGIVGERMENGYVPSVETDEDGSARTWTELLEPDGEETREYTDASRAVCDLIRGAADVSEWAVTLGVEGLVPAEPRLYRSVDDGPVHAAFHIALDRRLELDARAYDAIADVIRGHLLIREDGAPVVEQPAAEACGKCKRPFDPADTRFDGRARYHLTPYCRGCVDRCHDNESADHRCVICA